MLDYNSTMNLFNYAGRIYRRIWRLLFASNFKRFGVKSSIFSPLQINGAQYIEIGDNVIVGYKSRLTAEKRDEHTPRLFIGDRTRVGQFSIISCVRDVHIGKNVLMAPRVYISDNYHGFEDILLPITAQPTIFKDSVYIGDDTWIGVNAAIIGSKVGKHCVIGANSAVTRDIPDYCVAAGSPARVVKRYNFEAKEWQEVDEKGGFIDAHCSQENNLTILNFQ
jgi:acetyltransferase-like isoleucine patch superfamily enzyme